jgi:hypothetical protein
MPDPTITLKDSNGRLFDYSDPAAAQRDVQNLGYAIAQQPEIEAYDTAKAEREKFGSTSDQVLAMGELAASAATFGLASSDSPEARARRRQLRIQSPILAGGAEMAGALAPGLLTGGLGAAAAGGAELGAGARLALGAGSDFASGLSMEAEQAEEQRRKIDVGSVAMWTLGGVMAENLARTGYNAAKGFKNNVIPGARSAAQEARTAGTTFARDTEKEVEGLKSAGVSDAEARAQVGAETAPKMAGAPERELAEPEIRNLIENWDESVNQTRTLARDAGNSIQESFDQAHAIYLKADDVRGKVASTPPAVERQNRFFTKTQTAGEDLAARLEAKGAERTAATIRKHLDAMNTAPDSAALFIEGDQLKRSIQKFRKRAASSARKSGHDPFNEMTAAFDDVEVPLRKSLEDGKTWGGQVADKQRLENEIWSNKTHGFITNAAEWNRAFYKTAAGGVDYDGIQHFRWDDDKFVAFLQKDKIGQRDVIRSGERMIDAAERMTTLKERMGIRPEDMIQLKQDLNDMRTVVTQVKDLTQARARGGAIAKQVADIAGRQSLASSVLRTVAGGAAGGAVGGPAGAVVGANVAKHIDDFWSPVRAAAHTPAMDREAARAALEARMQNLGKASTPAPGVAAQPGAIAPAQGISPTGAVRKAGELAPQTNPEDDHTLNSNDLDELSEHARAYTKRQASLFASSGPRAKPLPLAERRFAEGFPSLRDAYQARIATLTAVAEDPSLLVNHVADSFGSMPDTHPALFSQLAGRVAAGVSYLSENLPVSVGASMRDPQGYPPSHDAMREFAQLWDAVWTPQNVFADLASGRATPAQLRAVQHVHPDLFSTFQQQAIRSMAERQTPPPYETQRYMDQVLSLDGAYSPGMSWAVARNVQNARRGQPKQASNIRTPRPSEAGQDPRGLAAISSGPTYGPG